MLGNCCDIKETNEIRRKWFPELCGGSSDISLQGKVAEGNILIEKESKTYVKVEEPPQIVVKPTTTSILRDAAIVMKEEQQRVIDLLNSSKGHLSYSKLLEELQCERQEQELVEVERKHLLGQLSYEEAILAKQKVIEENNLKKLQYLQEKARNEEEYERWRQEQLEKNKETIDAIQTMRAQAKEKKKELLKNKKEIGQMNGEERRKLLMKKMEQEKEELERKINLIREYKIIQAIRKQQNAETESVTEKLHAMSAVELRSKLQMLKRKFRNELLRKQEKIKKMNCVRSHLRNTALNFVRTARQYKNLSGETAKRRPQCASKPTNSEIAALQEKLEQARFNRKLVNAMNYKEDSSGS